MHILAISPGERFDPERWRKILHSGIDAFMVREKQLTPRLLLERTRWVMAEAPDLAVWVNGRLDVALAAGCGLHAPETYPPVPSSLVHLSMPVHGTPQFEARKGCRQLLVSPIFPVPGKGPAWGPPRLHAVLDSLPPSTTRILALGGIDARNIASVKHPRLAGVALIRALWEAHEPARIVSGLREAWGH